jgi:hypothetical protein
VYRKAVFDSFFEFDNGSINHRPTLFVVYRADFGGFGRFGGE